MLSCNALVSAAFYIVRWPRIPFWGAWMADDVEQHSPNDEQLVTATLEGDLSAFGVMVERHWNMVVALALGRTGDVSEAEDIAQESFLRGYTHLRGLRDPSRFAGWLSKIALQQCANAARRDVRQKAALGVRSMPAEELAAIPACALNPGLTDGQVRFVRETIRRLPNKFQELVVMRFVAGLSSVQIAKQLGKRPGTVRVWLHRAYKILRRDLAPLLEEVRS